MATKHPVTDPIFNAHTHVFKSEDTPSYLAKKFIVWPFYYLINTHVVIRISKWIRRQQQRQYTFAHKNKVWQKYMSSKSPINRFLRRLILLMANIVFFFYIIYIFQPLLSFWPVEKPLERFYDNETVKQFLIFPKRFHYLSIILVLFILFKNIRNTTLKFIWGQLEKRLGKEWLALKLRYINLLRYARYATMSSIFSKLRAQYPKGSKFVVLPMDMEFMKAGKVKRSYRAQMDALLQIKHNNKDAIYPFLFAHPKRMKQVIKVNENGVDKDLPHFDGSLNRKTGKYTLNDCEIKRYFDKGCAGVKIYPATGYYVFDKALIPLWLYCAQNQIPITTHCSVGPIFYRGNLSKLNEDPKKRIDQHPIFDENIGETEPTKLRLPLHKNSIFQRNFTHPLNYCCLLEEHFLKEVLYYHNDKTLDDLFGYDRDNPDKKLDRNLSKLKINMAHYGGAENWDQFLNQDRYDYANDFINKPGAILELPTKLKNINILYDYWHNVDWFSLISSMIVNYDNIYADVSYTSHDLKYLNLLSEALDNKKIAKKVLFGTDFYVVSNHKSEKQYWIDMQNSLGIEKWKKIADENPRQFLNSSYTKHLIKTQQN